MDNVDSFGHISLQSVLLSISPPPSPFHIQLGRLENRIGSKTNRVESNRIQFCEFDFWAELSLVELS